MVATRGRRTRPACSYRSKGYIAAQTAHINADLTRRNHNDPFSPALYVRHRLSMLRVCGPVVQGSIHKQHEGPITRGTPRRARTPPDAGGAPAGLKKREYPASRRGPARTVMRPLSRAPRFRVIPPPVRGPGPRLPAAPGRRGGIGLVRAHTPARPYSAARSSRSRRLRRVRALLVTSLASARLAATTSTLRYAGCARI